ncbi:MOSC domain-containing protein [bacterium]|nr:MOSC domain-containing protein [bacterium]MDB2444118.1 MOSC domain-containing protein [Gammaproteobacteria bacterium]MDG2118730.1 MOSC domain-containing protein [Gammaproteobacteria bacterium]
MSGKIHQIYIVSSKRKQPEKLVTAYLEAGKGIQGDRYHTNASARIADGRSVPKNQISLIDADSIDDFLSSNPSEKQLSYGDFRRSIVTRGLDLNQLVGKDFFISNVRCRGTELCEPCSFLAQTVHSAVLPLLVNRGGLRAIVLGDGIIKAGDCITSADD